MSLDSLDGDEQLARDLAVGVPTSDQAHDLLLTGRQPVELVVSDSDVGCLRPEGVEDEAREAW